MHKTVYLHIGLPKTASSLLQGVFMRHAGRLSGIGLRYLQAGTAIFDDFGHHALVMAAMGEAGRRIDPGKPPATIAAAWDEALSEIAACPEPAILISSELFALDMTDPAAMAGLRAALSAGGRHRVRVVLMLRDVVDFANSVYGQRVRDGATQTMAEYLGLIWDSLDWQALADRWAAVFGAQDMILMRFEDLDRNALADSFLAHLLGRTPQDADGLGPLPNPRINPSLPHSAVVFLQQMNAAGLPWEEMTALRNHLHAFLARHRPDLPRADFLGADARFLLQRHCRWPRLTPPAPRTAPAPPET